MTTSNFKYSIISFLAFVVLLFASCDKNEDFGEEGHLPDQTQNFVGAFTATGEENSVDSTDVDVLCFDFQYPINVSFPEGETVSFDDEAVLWQAIDEWYESNPNSEEDPAIVFPVTVSFEDGSIESITNDEDLCDLYFECYDEWEDEEDWEDYQEGEWEDECPDDYEDLCFDVVFPISIQIGDAVYTVGNFEEADSLVYGIIDALEKDEDLDIGLVFPIDVILEDGTRITLSTDEDLEDLEDSCYDDDMDELGLCFEIVYPIAILLPDGSSVDANKDEDVVEIINNWEDNNPDNREDIYPVFPVSVVIDSTTQVVNNVQEFETLLDSCD